MGQGQVAIGEVDDQRLGVFQVAGACRGIPVVADRRAAGQAFQPVPGEDIGHQPHALFPMELLAVVGDDAGAFLATVLQGVQTEIGEVRRLLVPVHADDGAFVMEFVGGDEGAGLAHACPPSPVSRAARSAPRHIVSSLSHVRSIQMAVPPRSSRMEIISRWPRTNPRTEHGTPSCLAKASIFSRLAGLTERIIRDWDSPNRRLSRRNPCLSSTISAPSAPFVADRQDSASATAKPPPPKPWPAAPSPARPASARPA